MHAKCTLTALYGVLLLTGGCMHSPAEESPPPKPAYREHHSVTGAKTDAPAQAPAQGGNDMLSLMSQDLQQRLGAPTSVFRVLSVQSVVWDDSSLGCPQPGYSYLPAQTPGVRVVLGYEGKAYQYHGSERGNFVYCEHPAVSGLDEK
jgi:hypothetical protein